jgi:hypothetical protein
MRKSFTFLALLVISLTLSSCSGEYISPESASSESNNAQTDPKELISQACAVWARDARVGDDILLEDSIIMPSSAVNLFKQAADLDYKYTELANAAGLLTLFNGRTLGNFPSETKNEILIAFTKLRTACL